MPNDALHWALGIACWLVGINSIAVIAFHHDKRMAQLGGWRVSEQTLLAIALLGGSVGALVARQRLKHKTRKQPFSGMLQAIAVLHLFILAGLLMFRLRQVVTPWLR